jgi:uncharacterized caspase-like protein
MSQRLLFLLLIGFIDQPVFSQGNTYAVVVGISDYQALTYRTGDLRFADRDAQQVAAFLQSKKGGNVPASHIRLLINAAANRRAIVQAMSLFNKARPGDKVLLYFSGHGMNNSFLPYDVKPSLPNSVLTHQTIKTAFRQSKARTKLCIADACLSGGMTKQNASAASAQNMAGSFTEGSNVALILAGRATEFAVEDRRVQGGVFTYFLLQGLGGLADRDANNVVTIRELHTYVSPRVRRVTRGKQSPLFYGSFPDSLALTSF